MSKTDEQGYELVADLNKFFEAYNAGKCILQWGQVITPEIYGEWKVPYIAKMIECGELYMEQEDAR